MSLSKYARLRSQRRLKLKLVENKAGLLQSWSNLGVFMFKCLIFSLNLVVGY